MLINRYPLSSLKTEYTAQHLQLPTGNNTRSSADADKPARRT